MTRETLVPRYYQMDPEAEDFLPNGKHLANGMCVLTAHSDQRASINKVNLSEREWEYALTKNRWCKVSNLETIEEGSKVQFVAVYDDGSKRIRKAGMHDSWLVKLDSIPDPVLAEETEAKKYNAIFELVKDAMLKQDAATYHGDSSRGMDKVIDETTKKIIAII